MEIQDISSQIKSPVNKILSFFGDELRQVFSNRILEYQIEEYKRNLYAKTILHRAEPKKLDDFYIPLKIIKGVKGVPEGEAISTESSRSLFSKFRYITLIGTAGSGKSTLVKYLFINCIRDEFKIPIKVELRYLNEFKGRIGDYVFEEIFKYQKLGVNADVIERLLNSGNFVFFFDGYDEVNSASKEQILSDIDNFVKKFNKNFYLITARPYTSIDLLPLFTNFKVLDLTSDDISAFVRKQLPQNESEIAEKIISAINKEENRPYRSFLSNPLLLSMFILTFQSYADVPKKRSDFYNQVFETLFSVHDSMSKLAYVREKQCGLSKDQFEEVLRLFSFLSFFEEKFLFPSGYLDEKLNLIKEKKHGISFNNDKLIYDLQVAIGILNLEGLDYTFPHRSLQEYFAACYIQNLSPSNKKNVYKKIKSDVNAVIYTLLNKEHFFKLLIELDKYYFYNNLILVLLRDIYEELNSSNKLYTKDAVNYYGRMLLIHHIFLVYDKELEIVGPEIIDYNNSIVRFQFFSLENRFFVPDDRKNEFDIKSIRNAVLRYKKNGLTYLRDIEKVIDAYNKSDEEIIKLI